MQKIETYSNTIYRYDNVLDINVCNLLCEKGLTLFENKNKNLNLMPWHDGDTKSSMLFADLDVAEYVMNYVKTATELINISYNTNCYPVFVDFVMWRKGRKMDQHTDDCSEEFKKRIYSTVLYLNDNYTGGETYINTEKNTTYISKPKQGTMVSFLSNNINSHGVNEILDGTRFTLPIWFGIK